MDRITLTTVFSNPESWKYHDPTDKVEVVMLYEDVRRIYELAEEKRNAMVGGKN